MLAAFGSLLGHRPVLFIEPMAILKGLDLAAQLVFFVFETESDWAIVVFWAISHGLVR